MVRLSVQTQVPVAIAYIEDAHIQLAPVEGEHLTTVRSVAGFGSVQIIEERSNGTLLIFVQGLGKVKLGKVKEYQKGFCLCEAEVLIEQQILQEDEKSKVADLHRILSRWIHTHIPDPMQQNLFLKNVSGPEEIVGAFSSYLVRDYDLQQMVLELNDINEKVRFLYRLVESAEITA